MRRTLAAALAAAVLAVLTPTGWQPDRVPPPGYRTGVMAGTKWTGTPGGLS